MLRVPTNEGLVYTKATMAGFYHGSRLTATLADWRPDVMPDVLAFDEARGWESLFAHALFGLVAADVYCNLERRRGGTQALPPA